MTVGIDTERQPGDLGRPSAGPAYDTVVVGAGILGLAVARELLATSPSQRVLVVEQADQVAAHQTSHNSGVIHAGVYYAPDPSRRSCVLTARPGMYEYCEQRGVEAQRIGKLIIALNDRELPGLDELERRARANGVPGLRRLNATELREIEPHASGVAALHSPHTGIVDFAMVCRKLAEDVAEAGGELRLGWPVDAVSTNSHAIRLINRAGDAVEARRAVFCAGLWADRLARRAGAPADPRIVPFRGGYLRLAEHRRDVVKGLIYPVPDPALPFLGIHVTPRVDGQVLVGPSALMVGARDAYSLHTLRGADLRDTLSWPGTWRMAASGGGPD